MDWDTKEVRDEIDRLTVAAKQLEQAVASHLLVRSNFGNRVIFYHESDGGAFIASGDGLRCTHCGHHIGLRLPDGDEDAPAAFIRQAARIVWPDDNERDLVIKLAIIMLKDLPKADKEAIIQSLKGRAA